MKARFTTRIIHNTAFSQRTGDHRLYCQQCNKPFDAPGCDTCKKARKAWLNARIQHYADTRTPQTLAQMVVELEENHNVVPEFEFEEEWPNG